MTDAIADARKLAAADMERFEQLLRETLQRQDGYLTENEMAVYRSGKKLRPLLLLISARSVSAADDSTPLPTRVVQAAVSLEMLHVATLIHDDIIDAAPLRRGIRTLNAAQGDDLALLLGDLQFVEAIRCFAGAVETEEDMELVRVVLDTGSKICRGEIDELRTDARTDAALLRERHLQTIDRKTAVLFGLACESGAALMRAGKKAAWYLGSYGRALGRAFQIVDDLSDFARSEERSGKRRFNDLFARRVSLPILYAMEELGRESSVTRVMTGEIGGAEAVDEAGREVLASQAFMRAYADARGYALEACRNLELLPDGPWRTALARVAMAVVDEPLHE